MTSPAQDIRVLIDGDSSLGLVFGTDLFVGDMPESPDACVALFDTGGSSPDPNKYFRADVQVLVRGTVGSYSETYAVTETILLLLHEYYGTPSGSTYYYSVVWASGVPFYIGVDESNRPLFSLNFRIQRR